MNIAGHRWKEIERGIEDGQQRRQFRGDRTRRRGGNVGGDGEDEVQELGGDTELHESARVGRTICREGDLHEDGEPDTRNWKNEEGIADI